MTAFALDANRSNFVAVGNVLIKPAYADRVDPEKGYKPKLEDANGNVVQFTNEDGIPVWTFDIASEDEDKALPITVTIASPHMPVVKRYAPVKLINPVLNAFARSDGKRATAAYSITCDGVESQGQRTPSVPSTPAKTAA